METRDDQFEVFLQQFNDQQVIIFLLNEKIRSVEETIQKFKLTVRFFSFHWDDPLILRE